MTESHEADLTQITVHFENGVKEIYQWDADSEAWIFENRDSMDNDEMFAYIQTIRNNAIVLFE